MIYFVDEDTGGKSAFPLALKMKGFRVATIPDATQALAVLRRARDVELVVIDVMLAKGLDPERCFGDDVTDRGLQTGLRLLELLCAHGGLFPARAVLLSSATNADLLASIAERSNRYGIPYWKKERFKSTGEFCNAVVSHLVMLEAGIQL